MTARSLWAVLLIAGMVGLGLLALVLGARADDLGLKFTADTPAVIMLLRPDGTVEFNWPAVEECAKDPRGAMSAMPSSDGGINGNGPFQRWWFHYQNRQMCQVAMAARRQCLTQ